MSVKMRFRVDWLVRFRRLDEDLGLFLGKSAFSPVLRLILLSFTLENISRELALRRTKEGHITHAIPIFYNTCLHYAFN